MNLTPSNENESEDGVVNDGAPSENYRHTETLDEVMAQRDTGYGLDITAEPLHVRAAFLYLSRKGAILWQDWMIGDPERRLAAARWLAEQYDEMNKIMQREQP